MADNKKLSELTRTTGLSSSDEFIVVDKSATNGVDASSTGRTSKIRFDDLKNEIGSQGQKGQKGQSGEDGRDGLDGKEGDRGEKGQKGPMGYKGEIGPSGDGGQKGQRGEAGIKGSAGDPGLKGQKGEVGEKGSTGASNASLSLVKTDNLTLDSTLNKISKISDGGGWNASVVSSVGFNTFNLSFGVNQTNKHMAVGVSVSASDMLYDNDVNKIFLCFRFKNDGTYDIMSMGKNLNQQSISYHTSSVFNLTFDKVKFTITQDGQTTGTLSFREGSEPNFTYAFDSAFYDQGTNLTEFISFLPGANSVRGPAGEDGQKGQKGQTGVGQRGPKGEKGDFQKGQKGQTGSGSKGQKGEIGVGVKGQKGQTGVGIPGQPGPMPTHQWSGTSVRFQARPGTWGSYVNVKGQKGQQGDPGQLKDMYVDWDTFAPVMFDITKEIKLTSGIFITRYYNYWDGSKWAYAGNGGQGSYTLINLAGRPAANIKQPDTTKWIAKALNVSSKSMKMKVDYMFGSDTDDNTKFGIFFQTVPMSSANKEPKNSKWNNLPGSDSGAFRGNGWGGARMNVAKMYNRYGKNNVEVTVPSKHYVYIKVWGYLHNGSNQYESVGLKSFNIHSPTWV